MFTLPKFLQPHATATHTPSGAPQQMPPPMGAPTVAGPVVQGVRSVKPSELGAVALVDATASSQAFGAGIIQCITVLAGELPKYIGTIHMGLHICRDLDYDRDADFSLGEDMPADAFVKNAQRIVFEGGGDAEETQFDACLTIARTYQWAFSPFARRAIVLFSSSSSKKTRDGLDATGVANELLAMGIKVVVVAPLGCNVHQLATATGGHSFALSNNPSQADLDATVALLTRSLSQMAGGLPAGSGTLAIPGNQGFGARGTQMFTRKP